MPIGPCVTAGAPLKESIPGTLCFLTISLAQRRNSFQDHEVCCAAQAAAKEKRQRLSAERGLRPRPAAPVVEPEVSDSPRAVCEDSDSEELSALPVATRTGLRSIGRRVPRRISDSSSPEVEVKDPQV